MDEKLIKKFRDGLCEDELNKSFKSSLINYAYHAILTMEGLAIPFESEKNFWAEKELCLLWGGAVLSQWLLDYPQSQMLAEWKHSYTEEYKKGLKEDIVKYASLCYNEKVKCNTLPPDIMMEIMIMADFVLWEEDGSQPMFPQYTQKYYLDLGIKKNTFPAISMQYANYLCEHLNNVSIEKILAFCNAVDKPLESKACGEIIWKWYENEKNKLEGLYKTIKLPINISSIDELYSQQNPRALYLIEELQKIFLAIKNDELWTIRNYIQNGCMGDIVKCYQKTFMSESDLSKVLYLSLTECATDVTCKQFPKDTFKRIFKPKIQKIYESRENEMISNIFYAIKEYKKDIIYRFTYGDNYFQIMEIFKRFIDDCAIYEKWEEIKKIDTSNSNEKIVNDPIKLFNLKNMTEWVSKTNFNKFVMSLVSEYKKRSDRIEHLCDYIANKCITENKWGPNKINPYVSISDCSQCLLKIDYTFRAEALLISILLFETIDDNVIYKEESVCDYFDKSSNSNNFNSSSSFDYDVPFYANEPYTG